MSVFDHDDYKDYLEVRLPVAGEHRGQRARLARALRCQPAYISQVLRGPGHFSLEHAALIDDFLGHDVDESEVFMFLVHLARAGSGKLAQRYERQLEAIRRRREQVAERIAVKGRVSDEVAALYYGVWWHSAVHVLLMQPGPHTVPSLAARLRLPPATVAESLRFLADAGFVAPCSGGFKTGPARIHLPAGSPHEIRHHINWRLQAIRSLDHQTDADLHYSGPVVIAARNAPKVRELLVQALADIEQLIARPGEDEGLVLCVDLFRL